MEPSQRKLLEKIRASRHFAQTVTLGRILQYVCEQTSNSDRSLKEYEIATEVLRRSPAFDPKLDPVVRVSMKGVRERLQAYSEDEGKHDPLRLTIPKGQYRVEYLTNQPVSSPDVPIAPSASRRFWEPYLLPDRTNLILHTEPLFFRDGWEVYIRDLYVNDPNKGLQQLVARLPELEARSQLQPSFHYLDAGEVHSVFLLTRFFHDIGSTLSVRNSRVASWNEMRDSNLILIGCTRTNRFMDMLQESVDFVITEDAIKNLSQRPGEREFYRGERYNDSKLQRYKEYVLVTRRPGASQFSTVTMIASNHGRAVEGAASHLSTEGKVAQLLARMNLDGEGPMAKRFQVLLSVEMIDLDDEIVDVNYVSHRTPSV
jgi:hypothetical protein